MQITVTGASGHIGGNLVRALLDEARPGLRIRALAHEGNDRTLAGLPVEVVRGDLVDADFARRAIAGSDIVYHLAAVISLDRRDAARMHRVNVEGTRCVLHACRDAAVRRLVYFSSIHAFSTWPRHGICDENAPLSDGDRDAQPYDVSKAMALRLVRDAAPGLDAVSVHPTAVIGVHDYRPSPMGAVIRDLATGRLPALVDGGFNFVDVKDVVAGAIAAERRARTGESYLLANSWLRVSEVAAIVERASGTRRPGFTSPMWLARAGAPFAVAWSRVSGRPARFTTASLHALRTHRHISYDKAIRELGYAPGPIAPSFEHTVGWMRDCGMLN